MNKFLCFFLYLWTIKKIYFFCIYVLRCESIKRLVASIDLAHLTSQINKSFHIFQEFILLWKLIVLKSICFEKKHKCRQKLSWRPKPSRHTGCELLFYYCWEKRHKIGSCCIFIITCICSLWQWERYEYMSICEG